MENPKIRFKGFTKDWEQRKLGDYLEVSKEKNRDEGFGKEDVLSVSGEFGIVNQIEFQGRSFAGASVKNYGVVEVFDIVYTKSPLKSNPYGIIKTNKGKAGIVSTLYAVYKPKNNVDSEFIQIYFELDSRMNSYMHPLVNKGAKNDMKVSDENALKGPVIFPRIEEQKMISQYFSNLDHLITLHQRKCDQTKNLKKYMLQKMFPQNGAKVPEIRFDGYTYDWEQRKLGDIGSTFTGLSGKTKEDFGHGDAQFITYMNVFSNPVANLEMTEAVEIDAKQNCVKKGDVFFTTSSETPEEVGMSCVMPENKDNIYLNSFCFGYRPTEKFDLDYLAYVLRADSFRQEMTFLAQGISRYNISKNKVMEVSIPIPNLEEQTMVGQYFSNLDHLITLHQRKCDELKKMKKYMLQNMFI
ncbi:MAG: restriction endonuclease subunit S [Agathobacter rectalis]